MVIKKWADKQVRKRDTRAAIEETYFQGRMLQGLAVVLTITESDESILQEFDKHLLDYLGGLALGARDSEIRLWGFKGNPAEWTNRTDMIATSRVTWNEDRKEQLIIAVVLIADFREQIEEVYCKFESTRLTAEETRADVHSAIDSFCEKCANHSRRIEEEATLGGFATAKDIARLKERAEKRVGAIMGSAMR